MSTTSIPTEVENLQRCAIQSTVEMELKALTCMCTRIQKIQNTIASTQVISSFVDCTISSASLSHLNKLILSPNDKVSNQAISTIKHLIDLKKFVGKKAPSSANKLKCLSIENLPHIIPFIERWIQKDTFFQNPTLIHDMKQVILHLVYSRLNDSSDGNNNHVTRIFTIVCGILGRYNIYVHDNMHMSKKSKTSQTDDSENDGIKYHAVLRMISIKVWFAIAHMWKTRKDIDFPSEYVLLYIYLHCIQKVLLLLIVIF